MERSRLTLSTAPDSRRSGAPTSFFGRLFSASGSRVSSNESVGRDFLRAHQVTFTVMRCSQVENADSPRNVEILRKSWRNASCIKSSASAGLLTMRRHKA